jgi:branched-chain amino acid transport system substrate-binding protein
MQRRHLIQTASLSAIALSAALAAPFASAQDNNKFKIGLILPMTGPFAYMGRQIGAGVSLYLAEHGDTVAGRKVEIVMKDDAGVPDTTRVSRRNSW